MIYFVGMHNKQGMSALDSRTHTGRVVDMKIQRIGRPSTKTNLANLDRLPTDPEFHAVAWHKTYSVQPGDTVILLGKWVQKHFSRLPQILYFDADHPSAFRVRADVASYVQHVSKLCDFK